MCKKSSLLFLNFEDGVLSSTTAGCRDVQCVRRAYAKLLKRGVASCIYLRNFFYKTWEGDFPSTSRVVLCAEKVVRGERFVTGDFL